MQLHIRFNANVTYLLKPLTGVEERAKRRYNEHSKSCNEVNMAKKSKEKRSTKKQKRQLAWGIVTAIAIVLIAIVVCLAFFPTDNSVINAEKPFPVNIPTETPAIGDPIAVQAVELRRSLYILPGIKIAGVDVGGKTSQEATDILAEYVSSANAEYKITLRHSSKTVELSGDELGRTANVDTVVNAAFSYLRDTEDDAELLRLAQQLEVDGKDFLLAYSLDDERLRAAVANLSLEIGTPAVNATVSMSDGKLVYSDDKNGTEVDRDALVNAIYAAAQGEYPIVDIPMHETEAVITRKMLEGQYVLRAKFSTSFSGSTNDRKFNVKKGSALINGTVLKPGETFSTNGVLGVRTLANGWKMAGAYVQGNTEQQAGGGVCQLSSTLYSAVLMADLEVVSRRNHSMRVGYVKGGLDATINSVGNIIDFRFKNNTAGNIFIVSYTEGNNVHMELYGLPISNSEYDEIRLSAKQIQTVEITKKETPDSSLPAGTRVVTREGKKGEVWEAYKEYYKDGKLVKKERVNVSTYGMVEQLVSVGTGATPAPSQTSIPTVLPSTPIPTLAPTPTPAPTTEP